MRNLTIQRRKSFVASLAKIKVYIEDHEKGETYINDIPCRKLGAIKNGAEETFVIEESPLKIFVIFDNLSKGYCNDCYELEAGSEDVVLSGVCKLAPVTGNAFVFDNNNSEMASSNRKRNKRIGWLVSILALVAGIIVGFAITSGM